MTRDARERRRCVPGGFTLIELLVVVSIICLLMSVLVPSVTRAQKQGEQIHCLANQHQLFLAWMLHITNNDDQLCPPEIYNVSLKSYLPIEDVFFCKTAESGSARTSVRHSSSYGISNTMGGASSDGVQPYLRFHKISHPGEHMVFADRQVNMSLSYWPLLRDHDQKRWLWREPNLLGVGGMTARHGNGCNMTFADGHGERIIWKDPRTLGLIKGTISNEVEASQDNPDLDYLVRILVGDRPVEDETEEEEGESANGL
jgi:prepilin-type N-terminal cleavage/methylation domain-containing protein/prepilin-type processing-associated H-X9-DG protein